MPTPLQNLLAAYRRGSRGEREKGGYFEELIRAYLRHEPIYAELYSDVWLYRDWAKQQGIDARDVGIDLVARTKPGAEDKAGTAEYHAIQCKFHAPDHKIQKSDIDSFFTASGQAPFVHRIIVSTSIHWTEHADDALRAQTPPVTKIDIEALEESRIDWSRYQPGDTPEFKPKKILRPHQGKALADVAAGLEKADRGKLIMACGTGKTLAALRIAETLAGRNERVLFLVPSLALLSQVLTEWTQESETPLHSFAVCSDAEVGKKRRPDDDRVETFAHELRYPATTNARRLAQEIIGRHDARHLTVVFGTYHSIGVISEAQHQHGLENFDLIICDEAHRATGATFEGDDESSFVKVHDAEFIRGQKRLYMTATPRIYGDLAQVRAERGEVTLASMDDLALFGADLHTLTFSEAVNRDLLVDYKVIILAMDEAHVSRRLQNLLKDENNSLRLDDAAKIVGCWKALCKHETQEERKSLAPPAPMRRAVAFCQVIEPNAAPNTRQAARNRNTHKVSSKQIAGMFQAVVAAYREHDQEYGALICEAKHVDGAMNASQKEEKLAWLKAEPPENTCRILSNVRCLSEGVDVPALDAVLFLTPRNSPVEVAQAVGRVMRRAPGKQRGYVILPVVIPAGLEPEKALADNRTYKVVWDVLQALRAHDDHFDAMINKMDITGAPPDKMEVIAIDDRVARNAQRRRKSRGEKLRDAARGGQSIGRLAEPMVPYQTKIEFQPGEVERALYARIVEKCGRRAYWEDWAGDIARIARAHITRIETILQNPANKSERRAFRAFVAELRDDLNPAVTEAEVIEMLAQHLITQPVFEALFQSPADGLPGPVGGLPGSVGGSPESSESLPGPSESFPESSESLPGPSERIPVVSESVTGPSRSATGLPESFTGPSESAPGYPESFTGYSESSPEPSESLPGTSEGFPGPSDGLPRPAGNRGFVQNNPVSRGMRQVLALLHEHHLEKETDTLERFYASVKMRAEGIDSAEGKQKIILELYDKFFRNAFPRMTERLGIVYTPVEVVDFILHSIDHLLRAEFRQSLASPGVHILDPFAGAGTFLVRLLQSGLIDDERLPHKYRNELHANEIVLLAYYIAAIDIEAAYHGRMAGEAYQPFPGICLTDTFQLHEADDQIQDKLEENSRRRMRQKGLKEIRVILGNPPYSAGQGSANDNNQNIKYPRLDERIRATYVARTNATNKNALYDSYIRAIRWASDRIGDRGVIGFVTNAGWIEGNAMDGLRKCLAEEFSSLYLLHLRGNQRTQGELSRREGGKIFGGASRAPIAISLLVKNPDAPEHGKIRFHDIGDYLTREEKLERIKEFASIDGIAKANGWREIIPDRHGDWLNQRENDFDGFIVLGDKKDGDGITLFESYSVGIKTQRDAWCYNASKGAVEQNMGRMIEFYNREAARFQKAHAGLSTQERQAGVNSFIDTDPAEISWTRALKADLAKDRQHTYQPDSLIPSLYRPFTKQWLYYNRRFNEMVYQMPRIFPHGAAENRVICISGIGARSGFSALMVNALPNLHTLDTGQCFPRHLYDLGGNRRDALTDAGLARFQRAYPGQEITRDDLFHYIYGLLHSEDYRRRYANNLGKQLPRIPAVNAIADFRAFAEAGRRLAELHLNYETVEKYPAAIESRASAPEHYRVEKMRHGKKKENGKTVKDLSTIHYNQRITLRDVPPAAYRYVVNGKPAIDWVMERQSVKTDKKSGIVNDANHWALETMGNPQYPLELLLRVIAASINTMKIVDNLPALDI